jgi:hypothetical protein
MSWKESIKQPPSLGQPPSQMEFDDLTKQITFFDETWESLDEYMEGEGETSTVRVVDCSEYPIEEAVDALENEGCYEPSSWPWTPETWYLSDTSDDPYSGEIERTYGFLHGFTPDEQRAIWAQLTGRTAAKQPPSAQQPAPLQNPLSERKWIEVSIDVSDRRGSGIFHEREIDCTGDAELPAWGKAVLALYNEGTLIPTAVAFYPGIAYEGNQSYSNIGELYYNVCTLHGFDEEEEYEIYRRVMGVRKRGKTAIKQPPSNPAGPPQLQLDQTTHKWIMNYFERGRFEPIDPNDPDSEYDYVEGETNEERIPCDAPGENPVEYAANWLARSGLSERDGGTGFYDPDGSQQDYRTGDDIRESAHLHGFTDEEVDQIHDILDREWTKSWQQRPNYSSWKQAAAFDPNFGPLETLETLYKGIPAGQYSAQELTEFHADPVRFVQQHMGLPEPEVPPSSWKRPANPEAPQLSLTPNNGYNFQDDWTPDFDHAYNYAMDRDFEGWARELAPDEDEQDFTVGIVLDAVVEPGTYQHDEFSHAYDGHYLDAGAQVMVHGAHVYLVNNQTGNEQAHYVTLNDQRIARTAAQGDLVPIGREIQYVPLGTIVQYVGPVKNWRGRTGTLTDFADPSGQAWVEFTKRDKWGNPGRWFQYWDVEPVLQYQQDEPKRRFKATSWDEVVEKSGRGFEVGNAVRVTATNEIGYITSLDGWGHVAVVDFNGGTRKRYWTFELERVMSAPPDERRRFKAGIEDSPSVGRFYVGCPVVITQGGMRGMHGIVTLVSPVANGVEVLFPDDTNYLFPHDYVESTGLQVQREAPPRRFKAGIEDMRGLYRLYRGCPVEFVRGLRAGETGVVQNIDTFDGMVSVLLDNDPGEGHMPTVWVAHECLEPLLQMQQERPDVPRRWKPSHAFDPKQITLDPLVFDHDDRLYPRLQKFIQHEVEQLFSRSGLGHQHFTSYLSGPIASYRYNPLGDADLYIVPDYDNLPAHSNRDELYKHWQNQAVEHIDGTHLPGSRHRLHAIVVKPGVTGFDLFNDKDRPAWDFSKQDWLVRPVREHSDESQALEHHIERAHEVAEKVQMLDPKPKREYRTFLKRRSDEEPNLFSTPTMIFQFLNDQKLAASPQDKMQAQQTMDSIKNSPAYQQILTTKPDRQNALNTFTNDLVNRYPQLHPLFWNGVNHVANGNHPVETTQSMRDLHRHYTDLQDSGALPHDYSPAQHESLFDMQTYLEQRQEEAKLLALRHGGGETVFDWPDGWHVDLATPDEVEHHADWYSLQSENPIQDGSLVGYTIRDQDGDPRVYLTFANSEAQSEHSNYADYFRPHTLHPGGNEGGSWEVASIGYTNKHKEYPNKDRWEDDHVAQEHGREWIQHMKQWGQRFDAQDVVDEPPSIDGARDLESWYEDNFDGSGTYRDPSDPFGFGEGEVPGGADFDELIQKCVYGVLQGADRGWGNDAVSDPEGLADAFYELWRISGGEEAESLQRLAEKADEFVYEQFDEYMDMNYSYFAEGMQREFGDNIEDYTTKEQQYELEQLEEEDDEDGGNRKEERLEEIYEDMQDEHEDMWYALEGKVRDEWWKYSPYDSAGKFASRLHELAQRQPKQSAKEPPSAWGAEPSAPMFERLPGELPEQPVQYNESYGVGGTLDDRDLGILHQRALAYDKIPGPRIGDWVRWAGGSYARFCHDWGDQLQTTDGPNGGSFYLGDGYISYSGGLDPGILKSTLHQTGELKLGSVWFFHHDSAGGGRGVHAQMDFRVFDSDPQNEDAWWRKRQTSSEMQECPDCGEVFPQGALQCPHCGFQVEGLRWVMLRTGEIVMEKVQLHSDLTDGFSEGLPRRDEKWIAAGDIEESGTMNMAVFTDADATSIARAAAEKAKSFGVQVTDVTSKQWRGGTDWDQDSFKLAMPMTPNQRQRALDEAGVTWDDSSQVVYTFPDGYSIAQLKTQGDVYREGVLMYHCWGDEIPQDWYAGGQTIPGHTMSLATGYYSVRDPKNNPKLSFYFDPPGYKSFRAPVGVLIPGDEWRWHPLSKAQQEQLNSECAVVDSPYGHGDVYMPEPYFGYVNEWVQTMSVPVILTIDTFDEHGPRQEVLDCSAMNSAATPIVNAWEQAMSSAPAPEVSAPSADQLDLFQSSAEKLKVVYDFDGDRISLGTLSEVQGNPHIVGEYDGKDVHLDQPENAWLNKDYFTQLWQTQFPERPLENVHINISAPKLASYLPFYSDCVSWPNYNGHCALDYLIDHGQEISKGQFQRMTGTTAAELPGGEWGTFYYRVPGLACYYYVNSAIEYVWATRETIAAMDKLALEEHLDWQQNGPQYVWDEEQKMHVEKPKEAAKQPYNQDDRSQRAEQFDLPEPMQLMLQAGEDLQAEPGSIEIVNHAMNPNLSLYSHGDGTHWARLFYTHQGRSPFATPKDREQYIQDGIDEGYDPDLARRMADEYESSHNSFNHQHDGQQKAADYFYYPDHGWVLGAN